MPSLNIDAIVYVEINLLREKATALAVSKKTKRLFAKVFRWVASELEAEALIASSSGQCNLTTLPLSVAKARQRAHDLRMLAIF